MSEPLLQIRNLSTWYPIRRGVLARATGHVQALTDVSLDLRKGETLAVIGESGCGKTTLGRTILGLEQPLCGSITFAGHDLSVPAARRAPELRRQIQMVFQDPAASLNPRMMILDLLTEGPRAHGLLNGQAPEEFAGRLLKDVGMEPDVLHRYSLEFSGGQRQRISIARALSVQPSLIVCDEAVSALDVSVQAQVLNLLMDLKERYGLSYLFISHDLRVVRNLADRVAVMYLGRVMEEGATARVMEQPCHPYTQALFSAIPTPGAERGARTVLKGEIPSPVHPPQGCPFNTRCPRAFAPCFVSMPPLISHSGRNVACHLYSTGP